MARELTTISKDTKKYIPKDWLDDTGKPEDNALVFKFQPLSKRQLAQFSDNSTRLSMQSNTILLGNAENLLSTFRTNITGWENLIVDGAPREFKKDSSTGLMEDDITEIIPLDIIEEVASHIVKVSKFPEDELKK